MYKAIMLELKCNASEVVVHNYSWGIHYDAHMFSWKNPHMYKLVLELNLTLKISRG